MPESKRGTSEDNRSKAEQKVNEQESAEQQAGALDNPMLPDKPSEIKHSLYFTGVIVGSFILNVVVLIIVSGGS